MILPSQRHLFDIPDDVAYLNCAYMSPLMKSVQSAGIEGLRRKGRPWTIAARDFFTASDELRRLFAELVGAKSRDIAIIPAASYGVSLAARNLPLAEGQRVLVLADQFPSNIYPWRERAREVGAEVSTLERPEPGGPTWSDAVRKAIATDERLAVVALPHCHWIDGELFDLEAIGSACRERGIGLSLDVTQSLGAVPLEVSKIQPDFLTAATYKWLMGPYSLGLVYVASRWQEEGVGLEHNWIHRRGAENFARLIDYEDRYEPGAARFDVGERSNFALVPAAVEGLRQLLEWGVDNIAETLGAKTEELAERARELGLAALQADRRAPHYLALQLEEEPPERLLTELAERKVYVSLRGPSIRVTPHVYNTDEDRDRFLAALGEVLALD